MSALSRKAFTLFAILLLPAAGAVVAQNKAPSARADTAVRGLALIEKAPSLARGEAGWNGLIFADGRRLSISPATQVDFVPSKSEKAQAQGKGASSLQSLDQVGPNVFIAYQARPQPDGTLAADRLVFTSNQADAHKLKERKQYEPTVALPDYAAHAPGHLVIGIDYDLAITPDAALQQMVSEVGLRLVPAFQRSLPDDDPFKIHFRFFVVESDEFAIRSLPNGVILVASDLLPRLAHEAQLAAVISADLALVVQESELRMRTRTKRQTALWLASSAAPGAFAVLSVATFLDQRQLLNTVGQQAARLAIEYLLDAGYDPREAESAFQALSHNSKGSRGLGPMERHYYSVMAREAASQFAANYTALNFSSLKTDSADYEKLRRSMTNH